jgi:hypothetical protein
VSCDGSGRGHWRETLAMAMKYCSVDGFLFPLSFPLSIRGKKKMRYYHTVSSALDMITSRGFSVPKLIFLRT